MTSTAASVKLEFQQPESQEELADFVARTADAGRSVLYPSGGKTAWDYGNPITEPGTELSTLKLNRVIDFPARDMTVTVEAGMTVSELQKLLGQEQQQLPIDVPHAERATLGGIIACTQSGPRRFGYGTLRDYLIGVSAVDAFGRTFHAGGRVVKNVAGYDLCKLLIGSLGTLGVVTQLTFKLKPITAARCWLVLAFEDLNEIDLALEMLITSETRPVAQEVVSPRATSLLSQGSSLELSHAHLLCIRFEGSSEETLWQSNQLRQELGSLAPVDILSVEQEQADRFLQALTDFPVAAQAPLIFRASMLPSAVPEFLERCQHLDIPNIAHAANGIVLGHFQGDPKLPAIVEELRGWCRKHSGSLIVTQATSELQPALSFWGDSLPSWKLMGEIKQKFDPQNRWNPGRFLV